MDFETYWKALVATAKMENIRHTPSFVLSKLTAEHAWYAAQKKEEEASPIDHVYLIKAFWPSANAVLIWRDNTFETERDAKEAFNAYSSTFPESECPKILEVIRVTVYA